MLANAPEFDGGTYEPEHDKRRLLGVRERVEDLMSDGAWRTLGEIHKETGVREPTASARLRDFRKEQFGGHTVERRARGARCNGLFEYRLIRRPEQCDLLN